MNADGLITAELVAEGWQDGPRWCRWFHPGMRRQLAIPFAAG